MSNFGIIVVAVFVVIFAAALALFFFRRPEKKNGKSGDGAAPADSRPAPSRPPQESKDGAAPVDIRPIPSRSSQENKGGAAPVDSQPVPSRLSQELVMGVDFGTAVTKVVIRALAGERSPLPSEYVCAVDFGRLSELDSSYLLQTALWTDGSAAGLDKREGCRRVTDIKIRLMRGELNDIVLTETAAYLAAVIRHARAWFADKNSIWLKDADETWSYNIGIPADLENSNDRATMRSRYHLAADVAVMMAESNAPISIDEARVKLALDPDQSCGKVDFVPEVVAQAVGYAQAQGAIEGLNVMVDVGAWTLDACSFILLEANRGVNARFHVQSAKVEELGCIPLHRKRESAGCKVEFDPSRPLPPLTAYAGEDNIRRIGAVDNEFGERCARHIRWILGEAKRVAKREAVFRGEGRIAFIVCGGGCLATPFRDISRRAWTGFVRAGGVHHGNEMQAIHITARKPHDLDAEGIDDGNYHRLSVAWGLSYPNIRRTLPSGTVVD